MKIIHFSNPEEVADNYDKCISNAPNGNIYALSWYLNITCPDWEFLGTDDFITVMPLPVFKNLGRKILKQPEYTYQLGLFSTAVPNPDVLQTFLDQIPGSYRLKHLCMNKFNLVKSNDARFHNSFELDLIRSYKFISTLYSAVASAELQKAKKASLSYMGSISAHDLLMFSYRLDAFNKHRLKPSQMDALRLITSRAIRYRSGQIAAAYDASNNLCASLFFLKFNGRISIHHAAANPEGIRNGAIYFLLDAYIRENAEQNMVLCIDDPDAKRLSEVFLNLGSSLSTYPCLKRL
jgi:hypothetical protein